MARRGQNAAAIGREIRAELSRTIAETMTRAVMNLRETTPVDTGHARSNWVLSVGRPYTGVDGSRLAVSMAASDAGLALMARYDVGKNPRVFLRNNVEYITYLDEGWSPQAPPNFVAMAINDAANGVQRGRRGQVRKMLKGLARAAIVRRGSTQRRNAIADNNLRVGR